MKHPFNFSAFIVALALAVTVFFNPAMQVLAQDETETAKEHAMQHTDPAYVCPMHADVRSDEPGACPVCGMHLLLEQAASSQDDEHGADGEKQ
jgi:Cu(I)/Ag(I) efflux system membrane fusion protein